MKNATTNTATVETTKQVVTTKLAKNGARMYYVDGKRVARDKAIEVAAEARGENIFTVAYEKRTFVSSVSEAVKSGWQVWSCSEEFKAVFTKTICNGTTLYVSDNNQYLGTSVFEGKTDACKKIAAAIEDAFFSGKPGVKISWQGEVTIVETAEDKPEVKATGFDKFCAERAGLTVEEYQTREAAKHTAWTAMDSKLRREKIASLKKQMPFIEERIPVLVSDINYDAGFVAEHFAEGGTMNATIAAAFESARVKGEELADHQNAIAEYKELLAKESESEEGTAAEEVVETESVDTAAVEVVEVYKPQTSWENPHNYESEGCTDTDRYLAARYHFTNDVETAEKVMAANEVARAKLEVKVGKRVEKVLARIGVKLSDVEVTTVKRKTFITKKANSVYEAVEILGKFFPDAVYKFDDENVEDDGKTVRRLFNAIAGGYYYVLVENVTNGKLSKAIFTDGCYNVRVILTFDNTPEQEVATQNVEEPEPAPTEPFFESFAFKRDALITQRAIAATKLKEAEKAFKAARAAAHDAQYKFYDFMTDNMHRLNEKFFPLPDAEIEVKTVNGNEAFIYPATIMVDFDDTKFILRGDCSELNGLTLGTYDTPEQVERAVEQFKAAINRGDKRFDFANPDKDIALKNVDKNALSDRLKRAMKIAWSKADNFARIGQVSNAETERQTYVICRDALATLK